jgi:phosphoribosylaminoimidazolecarboxamide formyltransferase/IMP cyclohydrolase
VDEAVSAGISAIAQPGGSVSDYDVIAACNETETAMVFTGERCFSHH